MLLFLSIGAVVVFMGVLFVLLVTLFLVLFEVFKREKELYFKGITNVTELHQVLTDLIHEGHGDKKISVTNRVGEYFNIFKPNNKIKISKSNDYIIFDGYPMRK